LTPFDLANSETGSGLSPQGWRGEVRRRGSLFGAVTAHPSALASFCQFGIGRFELPKQSFATGDSAPFVAVEAEEVESELFAFGGARDFGTPCLREQLRAGCGTLAT
jgi:hypothetical protein